MRSLKLLSILLLICAELWTSRALLAQESERTPSEKTKDAVDKFNSAPSAIGKSLQGLRDAAKNKLQQTLGGKAKAEAKAEGKAERVDLDVPRKAPDAAAPALPQISRDPFRPYSMKAKSTSRRILDESLPPILRYDIGEFQLVGIAGYDKSQEWKALVLAPDKKGYTLSVGMDIGSNAGKVKTINSSAVVIEENSLDKKSKTPITWSCIVGKLCSHPTVSTNRESGQYAK